MKKAVGYIRVSTDEQASDGVSLSAQRTKLAAWAELMDTEIVAVYEDAGFSAKSLKRPGVDRLLADIAANRVECLVVTKLDRLTRSVRDLGWLMDLFEKKRVEFASIGETLDSRTAHGRLMMNMIGSISQWEREVIGERTREALAYKKANRERVGTVAYGKRVGGDGLLEDDPDEQSVIRLILEARKRGESLRSIASGLNESGLRTRSCKPWQHQYVDNVIRSAK